MSSELSTIFGVISILCFCLILELNAERELTLGEDTAFSEEEDENHKLWIKPSVQRVQKWKSDGITWTGPWNYEGNGRYRWDCWHCNVYVGTVPQQPSHGSFPDDDLEDYVGSFFTWYETPSDHVIKNVKGTATLDGVTLAYGCEIKKRIILKQETSTSGGGGGLSPTDCSGVIPRKCAKEIQFQFISCNGGTIHNKIFIIFIYPIHNLRGGTISADWVKKEVEGGECWFYYEKNNWCYYTGNEEKAIQNRVDKKVWAPNTCKSLGDCPKPRPMGTWYSKAGYHNERLCVGTRYGYYTELAGGGPHTWKRRIGCAKISEGNVKGICWRVCYHDAYGQTGNKDHWCFTGNDKNFPQPKQPYDIKKYKHETCWSQKDCMSKTLCLGDTCNREL